MADHEHKAGESQGGDAHGASGGHKAHKKHHHHGAHAEHEHEEGWIVSFADNVLLMMGFFVILLAMNMGPKGTSQGDGGVTTTSAQDQILDVAIAVRAAFHNPVRMDSIDPEDLPLILRLRQRAGEGEVPTHGQDGKDADHQAVRPSDWSGQGAYVEFAEGQTAISNEGRVTIAQMVKQLAGTRWIIEVRGHASRWETASNVKRSHDLAYARAWAVASALVAEGANWSQIRLASAGDSAPAVSRTQNVSRSTTNQRAEIIILNETTPPDPYSEPIGEFADPPQR